MIVSELLFNKFKTKYTVLDALPIFKKESSKVVVYINLEMVLKTLFTQKINNELLAEQNDVDVRLSIISGIINIAQHYRWYFIKNGYDCEAYIYWNHTAGEYKNYKYNLDYRSYYNNKLYNSVSCIYLMNCMKQIIKITKTISEYVNGIHILMSDVVESSVLPYVVYHDHYHNDNSIHNIIVSNDKYDLQYVNFGFDIIVPRQDKTENINRDNVYNHLKLCFGTKNDVESIPTNQLEFVLSILGCKYRSISKLSGLGFSSIVKLIKMACDKIMITGNTTDVIAFGNLIKEDYREKFFMNYKCTSILSQYNDLTELDKHKILSMINDKFDDNALDFVNERYFQKFPIISIANHKEQIINRSIEKSVFDR